MKEHVYMLALFAVTFVVAMLLSRWMRNRNRERLEAARCSADYGDGPCVLPKGHAGGCVGGMRPWQ